MSHVRGLSFALLCLLGAAAVPAVHAQDAKLDDKMELTRFLGGQMDAKEAKRFAVAFAKQITLAAHPTASNPDFRTMRIERRNDGEVAVSMTVEYYGGLVGKQYPATITLRVNTSQSPWEIADILFADSANRIPPNLQKLSVLRRKLNEILESGK